MLMKPASIQDFTVRAAASSAIVAREKRRTPRNALAFWNLQVFAFARLLSARGEKLANPLSR
jgi:hypothetical protein